MPQYIYRLGLVTATVLLSLTSTIKLPGTPGNWAVSAQAQTTQEQTNEALRLNKVGLWQFTTGQFREALQTFEQVLGIVKAIGDRKSEGSVLNNIGEVYRNLGQYPQALKRNGVDSLEDITSLVTNGKNIMSAYKDRLSQQQIQDVSAYVLEQAAKDWH